MQKSGHFRIPIYQRLREDQFYAPIDQLCREVYGNFYVPCEQLGFWEEQKKPKAFAVLANNSYLTAEFTLFIF